MAGSMDKTSALLERTPQARDEAVLVHTYGLTKSFGARLAVNQVNLEVRRGDVFGLLGPNGSGKTTTLRMLLGLVWPTGGRIEMVGADGTLPGKRREALPRVGAIGEQPPVYPFLSGRQNLAGVATFAGVPPTSAPSARSDPALHQVGLARRAPDPHRKHSL